jgi:predicted DNA-binding WGR domain protein
MFQIGRYRLWPQSTALITIMNRTALIDSKLSLDVLACLRQVWHMAFYKFRLYCRRVDLAKNMARYYALSIQPTLFGEAAVVRCWGRIGRRGGEKSEFFATDEEALAHFLELARIKRARGYRPVASCGNTGDVGQIGTGGL